MALPPASLQSYRIAVGPQAGRKAFTLQTVPARQEDSNHSSLAKTAGFSLHAGIAAKAHQRRKIDRLLHHAETIVIEGRSFRMKDKIEGE
ncbi:MAG: hypothetical protein MAG794_01761 [Gammaproteobacteria bacterium]|nr:hypothetical protein [Gammaproteobacteria bacterium]